MAPGDLGFKALHLRQHIAQTARLSQRIHQGHRRGAGGQQRNFSLHALDFFLLVDKRLIRSGLGLVQGSVAAQQVIQTNANQDVWQAPSGGLFIFCGPGQLARGFLHLQPLHPYFGLPLGDIGIMLAYLLPQSTQRLDVWRARQKDCVRRQARQLALQLQHLTLK